MIARLVIGSSAERGAEITKLIDLPFVHPDVLYFPPESKLGIAQARIIKEHFSLKPFSAKGRIVVLEDAATLTLEAQNALLKTLEELPENGLFILGAESDALFLPTVLSRCQVIKVQSSTPLRGPEVQSYTEDIEKLMKASLPERFEFVEKLKDKELLLKSLLKYFRNQMIQTTHDRGTNENTTFLKALLQAEAWAKQNVNIRAILEYLMLKIPNNL